MDTIHSYTTFNMYNNKAINMFCQWRTILVDSISWTLAPNYTFEYISKGTNGITYIVCVCVWQFMALLGPQSYKNKHTLTLCVVFHYCIYTTAQTLEWTLTFNLRPILLRNISLLDKISCANTIYRDSFFS